MQQVKDIFAARRLPIRWKELSQLQTLCFQLEALAHSMLMVQWQDLAKQLDQVPEPHQQLLQLEALAHSMLMVQWQDLAKQLDQVPEPHQQLLQLEALAHSMLMVQWQDLVKQPDRVLKQIVLLQQHQQDRRKDQHRRLQEHRP